MTTTFIEKYQNMFVFFHLDCSLEYPGKNTNLSQFRCNIYFVFSFFKTLSIIALHNLSCVALTKLCLLAISPKSCYAISFSLGTLCDAFLSVSNFPLFLCAICTRETVSLILRILFPIFSNISTFLVHYILCIFLYNHFSWFQSFLYL